MEGMLKSKWNLQLQNFQKSIDEIVLRDQDFTKVDRPK
jgi:hypothetical protein